MEKLVNCKFCGKEISKKANFCRECGKKVKKSKVGIFIIIGLFLIALFSFRFIILDFSSGIMEEFGIAETFSIDKYMNLCQEYDYKHLINNPDFYKGKDTYFIGKITEVNANERTFKIVKNVSAFPSQTIHVEYKPFFNSFKTFEKGDTVKVYGKCNGIYDLDVIFGITREVPYIIGQHIVYDY